MAATAPTKTIIYNSRYRHQVDAQRRVQVPSMWRPLESDVEFTLIRWPKHPAGVCLRVLPPKEMAELMAKLDEMPNSDPNKGYLKRYIGDESIQVALDKAGRICIPDEMAKDAGIEKEAVFAGRLDYFEIWNPDRIKTVKTADAGREHAAFDMME